MAAERQSLAPRWKKQLGRGDWVEDGENAEVQQLLRWMSIRWRRVEPRLIGTSARSGSTVTFTSTTSTLLRNKRELGLCYLLVQCLLFTMT